MNDSSLQDDHPYAETREYITDIAFRRLELLEEASTAIDQKAGVLMGFVSVVIALGLSRAMPSSSVPLDLLFGYLAFGLLFASLGFLIACLTPCVRRLDPDVKKLLEAFWDRSMNSARENVAASLKTAWLTNTKAHRTKTVWFTCALWLSAVGITVLGFDILVVRLLA